MIKRIRRHLRERTFFDLIRKTIYYLYTILPFSNLVRKLRTYLYFKTSKIEIGENVKLKGLPYNVKAGKGLNIYDNVIIECMGETAELKIGDNCLFSYGVLISYSCKLNIGNDVQIGEYSSIRDTTHDFKEYGKSMKLNADISYPIIIGNNVWIGRGCIILPGTVIEDGVVVGANSVVKGILEKDGIYAGSPCRLIKMRI